MKILVLTFYFPPDLSAGAFRMKGFVPALARMLPAGSEIHVLTTRPNRYHSFTVDVPDEEWSGPVLIRRFAVPAHRSGLLDQARSFAAFARAAVASASTERYDLVFATSSRLMTAVLGSMVARRQRAPLYLDIRDMFVENMAEVLPPGAARLLKPPLSLLERVALRRADRVNLVSEGFADYFRERYPDRDYSFVTNGIDDEFLESDWPAPSRGAEPSARTVLYAGNMGEGQGLHAVVPAIAKALEGEARFRLIGDGGRREALETAVREAGIGNVDIVPPMNRDDLLAEYRRADVLFLHLNDYDAFRRVLPSKIFEYAATGKPIWAGVAGYAAQFLRTHVENVEVFAPCDAAAALAGWRRLDMTPCPRTGFVQTFSRRATPAALAEEVVGLLAAHG
jgi:glycosyltransferase involved in cell wall biosynthesis